ncbi:hypothetical protein B296_00024441, partial [Ensete ventricosum]
GSRRERWTMSSEEGNPIGDGGGGGEGASSGASPPRTGEKQKEKARVSRTSLILWHAHQNDAAAVRKLLEEDRGLVNARDYDSRTPLHVAALHGWINVASCLLEYGADVNAQDRWNNTVSHLIVGADLTSAHDAIPLADAEGAKKHGMIELLKTHGGMSFVRLLQ